MNFFCFTDA